MIGILVFVLALSLYTLTLSPTISIGDSPELVSSAYTLGIAHPPGYPLFSLLGKLTSLIFFADSIAYRINFFSALMGGLSAFFLYYSILQAIELISVSREQTGKNEGLGRSRVAILSAFLGAIIFSASSIFWSQAVVAEVYTLNAAFFTALLWLSLKWTSSGVYGSRHPTPDSRLLYLISFLWGLSLGNHHTMSAFGPVFLLFVILGTVPILRLRCASSVNRDSPLNIPLLTTHSSLFAIFFLLGLSIYLYLPIRSIQNPFMDWGDTERFSGFVEVILRKQFALGSREYSIERALAQILYYFGLIREQFTLPGLAIGMIGMLSFIKRSFIPSLFALSLFVIYGLAATVFLNPAKEDLYSIDVMVVPSFVVFSLWIGIGMFFIYSGSVALFTRSLTVARERAISLILTLVFLIIPSLLLYTNFYKNNQRPNTFAHDYAVDMFKNIKPNGVLFVEADLSLFPLWYMQYVEGVRKDVAVVDVDMLMLPWFKRQLGLKYPGVEIDVPDIVRHSSKGKFKPLSMEALVSYKVSQVEGMMDALLLKYPVYLSYEFGVPFMEFGERADIGLARKGGVFLVSKEKTPDEYLGEFQGLRSIAKAVEAKDEEVLFIARAYIPGMERMASAELSSGRKDRAVELMEAILTVDPYNADSLNNLAYLYADEGRDIPRAEKMVKRAMALKPLERGRFLKTLGLVYLKKGDYRKAIELFTDILKSEPGSNWTRLRLEEAYALAGKK